MRYWADILAAVVLLTCCVCSVTQHDEDPADIVPIQSGGLFVYRYVLSGDTLALSGDTAWCRNHELLRDTLTRRVQARLDGDSLALGFVCVFRQGGMAYHTLHCVRADSGGGIAGCWVVTGRTSLLQHAQPSSDEATKLARDTAMIDSMIAQQGFTITFAGGLMSAAFSGSLARVLLPVIMLRAADFLHVSIDTATDGQSVSIGGLLSDETVTVRFDGRLNRHYQCAPRTRENYTDWQYIEGCDGPAPWFAAFLADNVSFAETFMHSPGIQSLESDIDASVEMLDHYTVRITGRQTGEVVTVRCDAGGTVTYTSSDPRRETHTTVRSFVRPPDWWGSFCGENLYP